MNFVAPRVFLSWSGPRSRRVAENLHSWLPDVLPAIETWFSDKDIDKGSRWGTELARELEKADFAIVCVTPENVASSWLTFEVGCVSKKEDSRLWVYVLDGAIPISSPLHQFQYAFANRSGTKQILNSMHSKLVPSVLAPGFLDRQFERCWPGFEAGLEAARRITWQRDSRLMDLPMADLLRRAPELLERPNRSVPTETIERIVGDLQLSRLLRDSRLGKDHLSTLVDWVIHRRLQEAEGFLKGFAFSHEDVVASMLQILLLGTKHGE